MINLIIEFSSEFYDNILYVVGALTGLVTALDLIRNKEKKGLGRITPIGWFMFAVCVISIVGYFLKKEALSDEVNNERIIKERLEETNQKAHKADIDRILKEASKKTGTTIYQSLGGSVEVANENPFLDICDFKSSLIIVIKRIATS